MKRRFQMLRFVLTMMFLLLFLSGSGLAAHPDVVVKGFSGSPVSGYEPYSPKQTCGGCHIEACTAPTPDNPRGYCTEQQQNKDDYGIGLKQVQQHVGRILADGTVTFTTQTVSSYEHGVSVSKHVNLGRNEAYTADMRNTWKQAFFTSSPGMFGRY
jgi:hypothetical protein